MKKVVLIILTLFLVACSVKQNPIVAEIETEKTKYYTVFEPSDWSSDPKAIEILSSFLYGREYIHDERLLNISKDLRNGEFKNIKDEYYITNPRIPEKILLPVNSRLDYDIFTEYGYPIHGQDSIDINYMMDYTSSSDRYNAGNCMYLGKIMFYDDINSIVISRNMEFNLGVGYYEETYLFNTKQDGRVISIIRLISNTASGFNTSREAAIRPQNDLLIIQNEWLALDLDYSKREEKLMSKKGILKNTAYFSVYKILPTGEIEKVIPE